MNSPKHRRYNRTLKNAGFALFLAALVISTATGADHFANREHLSGSSFSVSADSSQATSETGEPSHGISSGPNSSLWWSWTAPASGPFRLEATGINWDTALAVYTGTSISELQPVSTNDDAGLSSNSCLTLDVVGGQTYQIAVDGYGSSGGAVQLTGHQRGADVIYSSDISNLPAGTGTLAGAQGWQSLFADEANGVVLENGIKRGFLSGGVATGGVAAMWLPINHEPGSGNKSAVLLETDWSVQHNTGASVCSYMLLLHNDNGEFLAGLEFEVGSATILRMDGVSRRLTGIPFSAWQDQRLRIWIDFQANQWSAKLDDDVLFERATFTLAGPAGSGLGNLSVGWTCNSSNTGSPSEHVSFANLSIKNVVSMPTLLAFPSPRNPYHGVRQAVPGRIEAEHYDEGGAWVGFFDNSATNLGGALRSDSVDVIAITGGYNVGYFYAGEWLNYSISVSRTARYRVDARVVSGGTGGVFHVELDGNDISGPVAIPNTGTWKAWTTVSFEADLPEGNHDLRIVGLENNAANGGAVGDIDWLEFSEMSQIPTDGAPDAPSATSVRTLDSGS